MTEPRPPYDGKDRDTVLAYLERKELFLVDPLAPGFAASDPYFAPSLLSIQRLMEPYFLRARANETQFRVYPVFVEGFSPNAFAADLGDVHVCAIHSHTMTVVFELAAFCFSQSTFFSEIGNANAESSPALPADADLGYWIADRIVAANTPTPTGIGEDLIPLDPERRLMAHFLAQMMMRFAWFHELYHALLGHCGLLRSVQKDLALYELPHESERFLVEIDGDKRLGGHAWTKLSHAFEFAADRAAFEALLMLQDQGGEPFQVLGEKPKTLRLQLVIVAGILMAFLFAQAQKRSLNDHQTHPSSEKRLENLVHAVSHDDGMPSQWRAAFASASRAFSPLEDRVPGFGVLSDVMDNAQTGRRSPGETLAGNLLEQFYYR